MPSACILTFEISPPSVFWASQNSRFNEQSHDITRLPTHLYTSLGQAASRGRTSSQRSQKCVHRRSRARSGKKQSALMAPCHSCACAHTLCTWESRRTKEGGCEAGKVHRMSLSSSCMRWVNDLSVTAQWEEKAQISLCVVFILLKKRYEDCSELD